MNSYAFIFFPRKSQKLLLLGIETKSNRIVRLMQRSSKSTQKKPQYNVVLSIWDWDNISKGRVVPHLKGHRNIVSTLKPLSFYDIDKLAEGKTIPHLITSSETKTTAKTKKASPEKKKSTTETKSKSPPKKKAKV